MKNLFLTVLFLLLAINVSAQKGGCGSEVSWTLSDGTLTIRGTGAMNNVTVDQFSYYVYRNMIKHVVIKSGVTSVGSYAFQNYENLQTVTFEEGLESIGIYAFKGCSGIDQIILPESIKEIEQGAFSGTGITNITIPESLERISSESFDGCKSLTTVNWNAIRCTLSGYSPFGSGKWFFGPGSVTEVNFGVNVKDVPRGLFEYCSALKTVNTSGSISTVGEKAFANTLWINNQPDGTVYIDKALYKYQGIMTEPTSIIVKEGTESITGYAFSGCEYLTDITIPSTLKTMGDYVFDQCPALSHLTWNAIKCTDFELSPFKKTGLYEVTLGSQVTNIPNKIFDMCQMLESVEMSPNIESIGYSAFGYCTSLKHVDLPSKLLHIGNSAFSGCTSLTNINLPRSLKTISQYAFNHSGLNKLFIPASVSSIENDAFSYNEQLEEVIVASDTVFSVHSPFNQCYKLKAIFVTDVPAFCSDRHWSSYSQLIKPMLEFAENEFVYSGIAPQMPQVTNCLPKYEAQIEPIEMATDAGTYSEPVLVNYTGERKFSVHIPYNYTIKKGIQTITWTQNPQTLYVGDKIRLNATSTSSLPVAFESDNADVCTIELVNEEHVLICHAAGVAHISVKQPGNQNWNAADPIMKEFVVNLPTGISENSAKKITVSTDISHIRVNGVGIGIPVSVYSPNGCRLHHNISNGHELVFKAEKGGLYIIHIGNQTFKVRAIY